MNVYDEIMQLNIENRIFINGEYTNSISEEVVNRISSYNGSQLPGIPDCDTQDVERAVKKAKEAFDRGIWKDMKVSDRRKILLKLAKLMEENKRELALLDAYETGRAFKNYYNDSIPKAIEALRYYAEAADKYYDSAIAPQKDAFSVITRTPLGVTGIITPWNDPMVVSVWKFAPALLMGNSVIIKPAEQSSFSIIKTAILTKEAGVPDGVFNVITGRGETAGRSLALNKEVRGIYFTGSSEVGKKILQYSGQSNMKKVGLECGGKSPFIVTKKCGDLKRAAEILANNVFYNQGQICTASSRAIIEDDIKEEFMDHLYKACEKYVPGDPFEDENNVGCVVSEEQYTKINSYINIAREEGGTVYQAKTVKKKDSKACCIQPTVITGLDNNARCAREEIFGPVVVILGFKGIKEAIDIANDTAYGLAGAVFTDDINEAYYAATHIDAGLVHINSWGEDEVHTPFGGFKESGLGKDRSMWAFDEYSELKTVWMSFNSNI